MDVDAELLYHQMIELRATACFEIAARALEVIRESRNHSGAWKARGDLVTCADEASEKYIADAIRSQFPDDEVICEEGTKYDGTSGFTWLCDPLDGTLNYARGIGPWAVSIGLLRGTDLLAGCVAEGTSGDLFTATRGQGAQRNGQSIRVSETDVLSRSLIGFDCPYDMKARMETTYPVVGELLRVSGALRCYGSCAVALCRIAAGDLDAYAVEYGKPWDFAAGTLLVREAGGKVTTWAGGDYHPQRHLQIFATNNALHSSLAGIVARFAIE